MSRFVMTLGMVSALSIAWIAFEPLVANATAAATTTTGTTLSPIATNIGTTASPQDAVNPAQLTSAQIIQIQNALNNAGFSVVDTGRWDPATASALQQFQQSRTFVSNGLLTNQTLASLGVDVRVGGSAFGTSATANASNSTFSTFSTAGTFNPNSLTSAQISELQQALRNRGFNVAVNGIWGPSTIAALQQFELSQGRASTGTLSEQTVADLGLNMNTSTGTAAANAAANLNAIAPAAGGGVNMNTSIGTTSTGQATPGTSTGATFAAPPGTITTPTTFPPSANRVPPSTANTGVTGSVTGTVP